ncbi:MAG: hypothetical protein ACPGYV_14380 [Phycisphaeraceae bacterium]
MKLLLPFLAVFCFALAGCQSTGSACCGSCGGHGHSHATDCCGSCGKDKAKCCGKCDDTCGGEKKCCGKCDKK